MVAHLASCPPCRRQVDTLRRSIDRAGEDDDAVDDGAGPPERVWRAIAEGLGNPVPARFRRRRAPAVLAAVLALVVGASGGFLAGQVGLDPAATALARLAPIVPHVPAGSGQ